MNRRWSFDDKLYLLGVFVIPIGIIGFWIYYSVFGPDALLSSRFSGCIIHSMTGYYCPGCGGTRAVVALLNGQIIQSFCYHPLVLYGVCVYLLYMVTHTLERLHFKNVKGLRFHPEFFYVAIGIIMLNFIIKNAVRFFWNIELL